MSEGMAPAIPSVVNDKMGTLYLLHWTPALVGGQSPRHYLGWTDRPVEDRVHEHLTNGPRAAKIVVAAVKAHRTVIVATSWPGTRTDESKLKKRKRGFAHICPICKGGE